MDFQTLDVLYRSRKTLLDILKGRGYNTASVEKFGPWEIEAMVTAGQEALRMDLTHSANPEKKIRVLYSLARLKQRLSGFLSNLLDEENEDAVNPATTEVIVITLEPIVAVFHAAALNMYAKSKFQISFFQADSLVNNPFEHVLVPKHEKMPSEEHADFLKKNYIRSKANLPLIRFHEDMMARLMGLVPGDIVKITRPSPASGEYVVYRVCAP